MKGRVRVMLRTGWTWQQLLNTPAHVLDAVVEELVAQQEQQRRAMGGDGAGDESVIEVE